MCTDVLSHYCKCESFHLPSPGMEEDDCQSRQNHPWAPLMLCADVLSKRWVAFDIRVKFPLSQGFIPSSFEQIFSKYHVLSESISGPGSVVTNKAMASALAGLTFGPDLGSEQSVSFVPRGTSRAWELVYHPHKTDPSTETGKSHLRSQPCNLASVSREKQNVIANRKLWSWIRQDIAGTVIFWAYQLAGRSVWIQLCPQLLGAVTLDRKRAASEPQWDMESKVLGAW